MFVNHLVKSANDRKSEALGYLIKLAANPDLVDTGITGLTAYDAYHDTRQGASAAMNAYRAGQGAQGAASAFARGFAPTAYTTPYVAGSGAWNAAKHFGGKAFVPIGAALAAYDTGTSISNQMDNAKAYRNTGQHYLTSEGGMHDTLDTASSSLPLLGAGIGTAMGGPVGTAAGLALGYTAQLGLDGAHYVQKGITGYNATKDRNARNFVRGNVGGMNAGQYVLSAHQAGRDLSSGESFKQKSWTGKTRDFRQENLKRYMTAEQTASNKSRTLTNKGQVA